ncbi:hypothetical protein HK100_012247 [Physocladia obscura]|uniref:C3H1-type domain-containing protein n=1 Tax=Physocladia obscura TaxID=109957 RepID=A0AAD5T040_9FUNG|nr:hypothetical protein HK100_012247 [Physocladia obscura]
MENQGENNSTALTQTQTSTESLNIEQSREAIVTFYKDTSAVFRRLGEEKAKLGSNALNDSLFERNKPVPSSQIAHLNTQHTARFFERMQSVIQEVVIESRLSAALQTLKEFRFLDIGAAPGAFSQWLISAFPQASGFGISLPRSRGGHLFMAECANSPRYAVNFVDILSTEFYKTHKARNTNNNNAQYNLIIADCLYLDEKPWTLPSGPIKPGTFHENHSLGYNLLTITQIHMALTSLVENGYFIMRVSSNGSVPTTATLLALSPFFKSCKVIKPTTSHQLRSSCYAVLCGRKSTQYLATQTNFASFVELLKATLDSGHANPNMPQIEFPSVFLGVDVITREIMERDGTWLIDVFEQAWTVQLDNILNVNNSKQKPCRSFASNGYCKFGDRCRFAH